MGDVTHTRLAAAGVVALATALRVIREPINTTPYYHTASGKSGPGDDEICLARDRYKYKQI